MSEMTMPMNTVNRILNRQSRVCNVDPRSLLAHPMNARKHPPEQGRVVRAMMNEFGWIGDIIVSESTGVILDGHLRVKIAIDFGESLVPVTYVTVSPDEEAMIVASFDQISLKAAIEHNSVVEVARAASVNNTILKAVIAAEASESAKIIENQNEINARAEQREEGLGKKKAKGAVDPDADIKLQFGSISIYCPAEVFNEWREQIGADRHKDDLVEIVRGRLGL